MGDFNFSIIVACRRRQLLPERNAGAAAEKDIVTDYEFRESVIWRYRRIFSGPNEIPLNDDGRDFFLDVNISFDIVVSNE